MSSSSPTPAEAPATSSTSEIPPYHGSPPLQHAFTLAAAIVAPIGLALPPRRFGPRSLLLTAGAFLATSQLVYDYTGQSIYQRFQRRVNAFTASQAQELPPAALQRQAAMRAERERRRQQLDGSMAADGTSTASPNSSKDGTLQRIWMGNEKEDWVKERARREQETLESGGGYWDLIMNQIGEVAADLMGKDKKPDESSGSATPTKPDDRSK